MKISRLVTPLLFATVLVFAGTKLLAVPSNPTLSFNEDGKGKVELPNGAVIPLAGALAPDLGPGGLSSALTFTAHPAEELFTVGDVLLLDSSGKVSDVFRFNPGTTSPAGLNSQGLVFYSSDLGGLLADTGLPTDSYANKVTILENEAGPTVYTPTASQPGFEAGIQLPITYQIFSTPDPGSTLSLLAIALCGIGLLRRKIF
jgi:hypothetical protein